MNRIYSFSSLLPSYLPVYKLFCKISRKKSYFTINSLDFCNFAPCKEVVMKKVLYSRFDKTLINTLPRVVFDGRIVVILSPGETDSAVNYLLSQPILGVDTETRPSFKRGINHKVSLLQVSSHDICFLFRLKHTGMTPAIIRLLEDKTVPKIGLSLSDDIAMLHKVASFVPGYFIDIQKHVKEIGVEDLSLQKLYANLFGQKISKTQRLTNWDADILNKKQKLYAATDAWTCINLYEELTRLKETGDYELIKTEDDV